MLAALLPIRCRSRGMIYNTLYIIRHLQKAERRFGTAYESDGKTTVNILNQSQDSPLMIDSYSRVGFRLNNGLLVFGPMAIFPTSVMAWNVADDKDITIDRLSLFLYLEPRLDVLIVGMGDLAAFNPNDTHILELLHKQKIVAEVLPTDRACATFNFLNSEKRFVAAALIPPRQVIVREADVLNLHLKQQKQLKTDMLLGD